MARHSGEQEVRMSAIVKESRYQRPNPEEMLAQNWGDYPRVQEGESQCSKKGLGKEWLR